MSTFRRCLILSLPFFVLGCASPVFVEREADFKGLRKSEIWMSMLAAAERVGFIPDPKSTDQYDGVFESPWVDSGAPFVTQSGRTRLVARIEAVDATATWRVYYVVEKQRLDTAGTGLNPTEEDWTEAGQDAGKEQRFLWHLRNGLGLPGIPIPGQEQSGR